MVNIGNDWDELLKDEFNKQYYMDLRQFLKQEYTQNKVFPPAKDIFNAFKYCSYENTKVVILGQDPYINEGEAHGLSFSVNKGVKIPPSPRKKYKEINEDLGLQIPTHGCLYAWAEQGVLLLNTTMTVREKQSKSHFGKGWERFTDNVIELLNSKNKPVVFLLWGNNAKAKSELISNKSHCILTSAHPSPLAGGAFFGCRHFSQTNAFLKQNGQTEIDWAIV